MAPRCVCVCVLCCAVAVIDWWKFLILINRFWRVRVRIFRQQFQQYCDEGWKIADVTSRWHCVHCTQSRVQISVQWTCITRMWCAHSGGFVTILLYFYSICFHLFMTHLESYPKSNRRAQFIACQNVKLNNLQYIYVYDWVCEYWKKMPISRSKMIKIDLRTTT